MTRESLPFLLHADRGIAIAELSAARLDGELVSVHDDVFAPLGQPIDSRHRAAALAADVPTGCTLVGRSAAWLHGAAGRCPLPVELGNAGPAARWARPYRSVRTMRIRPEDREHVSGGDRGLSVLTPIGTLIDLARIEEREGDLSTMRSLVLRRSLERDAVVESLERWTHLPGKARVAVRIDQAFAVIRR